MLDAVLDLLGQRGVSVVEVARVVLAIQHGYFPTLSLEDCEAAVAAVLQKREVQNAILTGMALDMLAEAGQLPQPLQDIIASDDYLYGVDEIMALAITNVYGSIGLTNFGYLDKTKPLIIGELNAAKNGSCHTFLDDLVAALAAAAASRIAHSMRN